MKPKRIQRKRTKDWRMPENTIYVGRPTKFANPFKVGSYYNASGGLIDAELAVTLFRHLLTTSDAIISEFWHGSMGNKNVPILDNLHELKGKNLACWCRLDMPCHADVLLELANRKL